MVRKQKSTKKKVKSILVFNVGSSSLKAALYSGNKEVLHVNFERIKHPVHRQKAVRTIARSVELAGFSVNAVAHRIVHGGEIKKHCVITPKVFAKLKKIAALAPLHDIPELEVVTFCKRQFGKSVKQIAIFDTAFHSTMPDYVAAYGLPYSYFKRGLKRYGFHGISHSFVTRGLSGKVISCHLGSGASVAAVYGGKSFDTSMGFTPLEGLVMGTRSGSIDPGLIAYLMDEKKDSVAHLKQLLNKDSGLLGLSGISADMRDLLVREKKNKRAAFAMRIFCYHVVKTIGSYAASMNGVNTIVFTAGIGENSARIREIICEPLEHLGVKLDHKKNWNNSRVISSTKSRVKVLVVPTNEELAMVQIARKLI